MKELKKIVIIAAAMFLVMVMMPVSTKAATSTVKLNKKTLTMYAGGTETLKITGTAKKVTWHSSEKSVATVTNKGVVTAKKAGKTVITVKSGSKKASCRVTVKKRLSVKQAVAKANSHIKKSNNITIKVYMGSVKSSNYMLTMASGIKSKVTYVDLSALGMPKMYTKGKKVYWYDLTGKKWYYFSSNDNENKTDIVPKDLIISGDMKYKSLGVKTFNGMKCEAIKVTDDGESVIYYLNLADYSVAGAATGKGSEKMIMIIDLKKSVTIPSSVVKSAKYKKFTM